MNIVERCPALRHTCLFIVGGTVVLLMLGVHIIRMLYRFYSSLAQICIKLLLILFALLMCHYVSCSSGCQRGKQRTDEAGFGRGQFSLHPFCNDCSPAGYN